MNFVRKAACHAGWDWGICLMPTGVYGRMALRRSRLARQESVQVEQTHTAGNRSSSTIRTIVLAFADGSVDLSHEIDGQTISDKVDGASGREHLHPQRRRSRTQNSGGRTGRASSRSTR